MMIKYYSDNFMSYKHRWNTLKMLNVGTDEDQNTRPLHRNFRNTGFRTHDASVHCNFPTV
jgi:hypothetical protein